jgi:hypothetical protein
MMIAFAASKPLSLELTTPLPQLSTIFKLPSPAPSGQVVIEAGPYSTNVDAVVTIFQFKSAYQFSEINEGLRQNMALAVSRVLEVPTSSIVLTIIEAGMRRTLLQQKGVLVSVGLKGYFGSTSAFTARVTQDNINAKMTALGLKSAQIIHDASIPSSESGI